MNRVLLCRTGTVLLWGTILTAWTCGLPTPAQGQLLADTTALAESYAWSNDVLAGATTTADEAVVGEPVLAQPGNDVLAYAPEAAPSLPAPNPSAANPANASPDGAAASNDTELAKRVATLEEMIRQMKTASAAEALPAPAADKKDDKAAKDKPAADKKDETKAEECVPKKIDTIVKPVWQLTGRIYFDGVMYSDDEDAKAFFNTDRDNEFGIRTVRLGSKGYIYENLAYNIEIDFRGTNSANAFRDCYMEQQELPVIGHLRVGHFKEPIGFEEITSDLYISTMEKSPASHTFTPARNFGVMIWDTFDECQDASWFAGIFRADSPDSPLNTGLWRSDDDDWSGDVRLAFLPYYDEPSNGRYLTHLGGSYSYRHIGGLTPGATYNGNTAYSTLNGLAEFSTKSWIGTQGPIGFGAEANSDEYSQLSGEYLTIWGPASIQSDYYHVFMTSGEQYSGSYVLFGYFLTGDNHAYKKDFKVLDRLQPLEPFFWVDTCSGQSCGWGAWEVVFGYSWVDLRDGHDIVATAPANAANRRRGFENAFLAGINWYHNSWSRMYFDYEHEIVDFVDGGVPDTNADIVGVRWQIDF